MRYEKAKKLKDSDFKRFCGVTKETFVEMCQIVQKVENDKRSGREPDLSVEDQVLLTLNYWREYRTMFHLGQDFDLHESNVSRTIKKIEDILIKCGKFSLPSKRRLLEEDSFNYTIVDVTEITVERPKKNKSNVTAAKRSDTP
jgi:Helix-turn-helix of DDE superfamily endonuclease